MGIGYKWILSFCMLIVPIAITLGVLFPLQNMHKNGGGSGSFLGDGGFGGTGPGSSAPKPKNNNVELAQACTQFADLGNPQRYFWEKGQQQYICMSCSAMLTPTWELMVAQSTLTNGVSPKTPRAACVWM